jgi:hypothetical protein
MSKTMNYYQELRQGFILDSVHVFGYIGRRQLQRKFGISPQQANIDIRRFLKAYPDSVRYCVKSKTYLSVDFPPNYIRLVCPEASVPCGKEDDL